MIILNMRHIILLLISIVLIDTVCVGGDDSSDESSLYSDDDGGDNQSRLSDDGDDGSDDENQSIILQNTVKFQSITDSSVPTLHQIWRVVTNPIDSLRALKITAKNILFHGDHPTYSKDFNVHFNKIMQQNEFIKNQSIESLQRLLNGTSDALDRSSKKPGLTMKLKYAKEIVKKHIANFFTPAIFNK